MQLDARAIVRAKRAGIGAVKMSRRQEKQASILPASLPPRGLDREQAAAYIGVSPSLFDQMVMDGSMPKSKRVRGRRIWDRLKLDSAFNALPGDDGEPEHNEWDNMA